MGGDLPWPEVPVGNKDLTEAAVLIIGAGVSGMCTAIDLIQRNGCKNFIIVDKSGGVGGTWRDNKYPGCCCDVWSHLYSYSFEQNSSWSREYPGQEEILQYLVKVAQKYDLYSYIRFNTAVESATWDDAEKKWKTKVSVQGGKDTEFNKDYTITSDFLVSAVGQLNVPKLPDIEGLDTFKGKLIHSARWDWTYDLKGKRAAIIGNGATAAQIVPEITKEVANLTIHQRTPNWVTPRLDGPIPEWKRTIYKYLPYIRQRKRADMMDFREAWFDCVFHNDSAMAKMLQQMATDHLKTQLADRPDLHEKLLPKYKIGCKRVLISDDYYPVFLQDNVRLETGKIDKITCNGIVTDGQEAEYDVIICATGFRTLEFMHPINITGSAGRALSSVWREGSEALYGVTVESLPNFGMLYGPNTNLGHNSIILMIEAQSRYINTLIGEVLKRRRSGGQLVIKPTEKRVKSFNEEIQKELEKSSFADETCNSWYKTATGKITNNWSGTVIQYQKLLSEVDWTDYDVSGNDAEALQGEIVTTKIGRVVEETIISYQAMGWTALSIAAIGGAVALRNSRLLRFR